ncbi:MAG: PTS transporter subunit EIIB [Alkalibacterium sp.]|nr:PTS transporter subunit EIIB [Alkalibacterium sp.]
MANNKEIAQQVIDAIGGKENVDSVAHCATRLRIMVNDKEQVNEAEIENIEKVKGVFNSGQYQIILGTGTVNKIYAKNNRSGVSATTKGEMKEESKQQGNAFQRAIRTFGDVFVPIIPVLVATGLFMGLRGLFTSGTGSGRSLVWFLEDISAELSVVYPSADRYSVCLPSRARRVVSLPECSAARGSSVSFSGLMLVNPALPNAYAVAGGDASPDLYAWFHPCRLGYQGTVLPAFIAGYVGVES